ncbi:hypothetical protein B0H16DRAFT_1516527 [Mycena metata]|uniref:Uncharacterized protein n=1 Tax=Mycena metata TaxID=1033252 RepID=A0AAD7JQE5_9AGAR|nr:hypothetical protein B0H16DRAFT_1516527 [Mycena metata]
MVRKEGAPTPQGMLGAAAHATGDCTLLERYALSAVPRDTRVASTVSRRATVYRVHMNGRRGRGVIPDRARTGSDSTLRATPRVAASARPAYMVAHACGRARRLPAGTSSAPWNRGRMRGVYPPGGQLDAPPRLPFAHRPRAQWGRCRGDGVGGVVRMRDDQCT